MYRPRYRNAEVPGLESYAGGSESRLIGVYPVLSPCGGHVWAVMGLGTCSASSGRVGVMWEPCGVHVVAMWRASSVYSPEVLKGVDYKYWGYVTAALTALCVAVNV